MFKHVKILGFTFINCTMKELLSAINTQIKTNSKTFIVTANPEIITFANKYEWYKEILLKANYIIPDGVGIVIASKLLKTPLKERVPGFDLMKELLRLSQNQKLKIYLLGTKPNIIDLCADNIKKTYPNIQIVGYHHGYFQSDELIIEEIKKREPDLVFVGLGYPKQEKWIHENMRHFKKGIFIGVGGSFNILAGVTKRAPLLWRKYNLEWLYRILSEPTRLKRSLAIPIYLFKVFSTIFQEKISNLRTIFSKN
ncbi:acetylglucosaminyldiphospho-UDP acetyl-beta-D-mannosaminyltransferase [Bacillus sp. LL01]|uniref:WecB/TagA/CpsF family glycosyltransferase n=1 Tax=Bacillus sp. LL01 TaxID=1665556 RepID=UPI00064D21F6|nr:WecB/TagA/CpsF family glycosyltransferase [Bacillus sp. LL01]KMJ59032.1 acetylglucosaminyldiphospho-UDP acetyl-beta-D-mannosaminyltransferase [Bacillus sp. LL01]